MALLAVLSNPYKEACAFMNVKAATPAEKDLLRLASFPQIRSKISGAIARKRPVSIHISGPRGEFVRFRMTDPRKYETFRVMVLAPKEVRGMTPTMAKAKIGPGRFSQVTLGVIGRVGPGKSELQSVLVPKIRVFEVASRYLAKPVARRVAVNPLTRSEAAKALRWSRRVDRASDKKYRYPSGHREGAFLSGASAGIAASVEEFGPREARKHAGWLRTAGQTTSFNSRRRSRRNPMDIATSWTGRKADYLSPTGSYGEVGYSELAMHVGIAGKKVVQFALFSEKDRWPYVTWAQVKTSDGKVTDGTAHEVLPPDVLRALPGTYQSPKLPHRGQKMMFNPFEVVHRSTGRQLAVEATRGGARARARTMAGTYPAGSIEIRQTASSNRKNPGPNGTLNVPFRTGKKYKVEVIDHWVRKIGIPAVTKRWEQALAQYKRFHKGSLPNSVAFNVQHLGVSKGITDVEFGVSEGKEWMAPYQVPKTSGKYEGDGSQGRYVHAHGDSEISVDIKRPVSTKKLPERFHTPDGKFVGVIPSRNVKITDWYRG